MKKVLCAALVALLLLAAMTYLTLAKADPIISLSLSSTKLQAGGEVAVTVALKNCEKCKSIGLVFDYDADNTFEAVSGEWLLSGTSLADFNQKTSKAGMAAAAFSSETDANGNVFVLRLRVRETAADGNAVIRVTPTVKNGTQTIPVTAADGTKAASCSVTVQNAPDEPGDPDGPKITVDTKKARAGKTVLVNVTFENNPGIWGMDLVVNYDKAKLTLDSVTNGTVFLDSEWTRGNLSGEKYILSYEAGGFENITASGIVATLEFAVNDAAKANDFYAISVSYSPGDIIDVSFGEPDVAVISGGVQVIQFVYGDLNGDEFVNKKDSLLMKMYLADNSTVIDMDAADVFVDGAINKKDSLLLKQHLADSNVKLGE